MDQVVSKFTPEISKENGVKVGTFYVSHHGDKKLAKMLDFRKDSELCDACFTTDSDNTKIFAHKLVLSVGSEFFRSIIKDNSDSVKLVVPLKDISGSVLSMIVDFIYTEEIKITEHDVEDFVKWSNVYQLPSLKSVCEKFLILTLESSNLWKRQKIATDYGLKELRQEVNKLLVVLEKKAGEFGETRRRGPTTALQSFAYYQKGFFTYDMANKIWKKIHCVNCSVYGVFFRDGNHVVFAKSEIGDMFLINLTDPSQTEKVIAFPVHHSKKIFGMAVCIVKAEIFFVGGDDLNDVPTNKVSVFNLTTNKMRIGAPMKTLRSCASAILFNNCIYVLGGKNKSKSMLRDVEKFDIKTGQWSTMAPLLHARSYAKSLVYYQMLYVLGGGSKVVERYNFVKNEWSVVFSELPCSEVWNALVIEGNFFFTQDDKSYRYDKNSGSWLKLAPFPKL